VVWHFPPLFPTYCPTVWSSPFYVKHSRHLVAFLIPRVCGEFGYLLAPFTELMFNIKVNVGQVASGRAEIFRAVAALHEVALTPLKVPLTPF